MEFTLKHIQYLRGYSQLLISPRVGPKTARCTPTPTRQEKEIQMTLPLSKTSVIPQKICKQAQNKLKVKKLQT